MQCDIAHSPLLAPDVSSLGTPKAEKYPETDEGDVESGKSSENTLRPALDHLPGGILDMSSYSQV